MAKGGNKKRFTQKYSPLGAQPANDTCKDTDIAESLNIADRYRKIPAVITNAVEKLTNAGAEERECGCNMIASLGAEPGAIELFMRHDVVRILGPLVKDSSVDVRLAALGALRNISVDGHFEVCDRMVDMDVMTPLVLLLKEYGPEWTLASPSTYVNNVLIQAINLLWNLCESSETAVKIFNQENLATILIPKLDFEKFGFDIALPTAHCLQTVSEENKSFVQNGQLQTLVTSLLYKSTETEVMDHLVMRILLIGILHNITSGSLLTESGSLLAPVIQQVSAITSQDLVPLTDDLIQKYIRSTMNGAQAATDDSPDDVQETLNENNVDMDGDDVTENDGDADKPDVTKIDEKETAKHKIVDLAKKKLTNLITSKQLALELLSNLCCSDDESDEWEEMDDCSDTEADQMDMMAQHADEETTNPVSVSDLHSLLLSHCVISDVVKCCLVSELPVVQKIYDSEEDELKNFAKQFRTLQERALICVNNMAASMSADSLGGQQRVLELWKALSQLVSSEQVKSDDNLLESVTSCIRAMAQKLAEIDSQVFLEVSESDLQFLYQLAHQSSNSAIRVHTVRTVATIGCMLAKQNPPHNMMKPIGVFLLVICMKDPDLIVVAETLDAIFDVFAEDHLDAVAVDIGLVQKLKQFVPVFKNKINQQKSRYRDHMMVISSAKTNLTRFIKYKNG